MVVGQVIAMRPFVASSAIYPPAMMPNWLHVVAMLNPLNYLVDALRGMMIVGGQRLRSLSVDIGVMAVIFVLLASIAAKLGPTLLR